MQLTRVYAPCWINKYSYKGQQYQIIMSGNNALHIDGSRPVDMDALNAKPPSFMLSLGLFVALLPSFILMFVIGTGGDKTVATVIIVCIVLFLLVAAPLSLVVTIVRRVLYKGPIIKLAEIRARKLAQRQQQHL